MAEKKFLMGNEALGRAALAAGAKAMYGYPITPTSEILHFWSKEACGDAGKKKGLIFLQAEDEIGASFMLIGAVLAGVRSFTATGGPGHVLMQDAFSMAEAMRLPVVAYLNQRGGPSTSTVIYSQSEVNLACFGGNGNGYRIVYSPATIQEMYDYGIKVFNIAWKYRFPTFLLGDGYLAKMMGEVELYEPKERGISMEPTEAYMLEEKRTRRLEDIVPSPELHVRKGDDGTEYDCFRNCLNMEEETLAVNMEIKAAWDKMAPEIIEHQEYGDADAEVLIVAHGIVAAAAKAAIDRLKEQGIKARLFRPITLRPFPEKAIRAAAVGAKKIFIPESALQQLSRFVRDALYGHASAPIIEYGRPSIGITPKEIVDLVTAH
ncbi:MAG TPA: transketolase C-terminal domain-containing protein [Candidatus Eisenbacteria bacterium]|nr:transketolase C-terminal domain-containing protein [Candidatus Eisenbacteria bacterium]